MISDEEKKALEWLKKADWFSARLYAPSILNLIEKQSKEIEELKEENKNLSWYFENQKDNFVHKDKIKAKIEEIEKRRLQDGECELALHEFQREAKLEVLQSLLEKE